MPQVQFYKAAILIGDVAIPCYPGAALQNAKNWAVPPIIGNYWSLNYGDGLRQPIVDLQFCIRDKAGEILSSPFLDLFFSRSSDVAHDISPITGSTYNGLAFWDGQDGFVLLGAKWDSFTIGSSKGDDIRMSARFVGSGVSTISVAPPYPGWDTSNILRFNKITFAGGLANKVWGFNLSVSNNCHPNMALDGTQYPTEWNAGQVTAGFQMTMQASDAWSLPSDGASIAFTISGTGRSRTFILSRVLNQTPDDRSVSPPRIMRQYQFVCLGGDAQTTPPVVVSGTGF